MKPEEKLLLLCEDRQLNLGLAESCTGGSFAARLTQIPGASRCFAGSIVSYQDQVKTKVLGIPQQILKQKGAVNEEVALKMLEGALFQLGADIAASVTGIAGPDGGTLETPVGTVYLAIGGKQFQTKVTRLDLTGNRIEIIQKTIDWAIIQLIEMVQSSA